MCGICGIVEKNRDHGKLIEAMHGIIAHRGPDAAAVHHDGDFWLGHRRLSIIDLSTGDQPIFNEDGSLCIIYNGEIYNYRELREELRQKGETFRTTSDTEVVLKLYQHQGVASFRRLNGIFALAILDKRESPARLVLARDHFGIKPLHYYADGQRFIFGSEQKSILLHPEVQRTLNPQSLHLHINLRYTQSEDTLFQGIKRLPPGHYLSVREGRIEKMAPYFHLSYTVDRTRSRADWIADIRQHLKTAVERQLVSDVPIGVYLSGGMDSSAIVAMMREIGVEDINTFTLGFNEPSDENDDAQLVADHYRTRHHNLRMSLNPMSMLPEVIWHAEEPKINLIQGFLMSRFVSQHVKVVLGGLGGDELFSGYDIHQLVFPFIGVNRLMPAVLDRAVGKPLSNLAYHLQSAFGSLNSEEYRRGVQMALAGGDVRRLYLILRNTWDIDRARWGKIYTREFAERVSRPVGDFFENVFPENGDLNALEQVYHAEFQSKMVNDYLLTEDRMSMANSIEERVPFLDLDLVQLGFSIPAKEKMTLRQTKALLREAMQPYLPEPILRKKKWGFTFNPYLQYQKDLKDTARRILTRERIERDGIFNYDFIEAIFNAKPHPRMRWHYNFIWVLTGLAIWQDMYINSDAFVRREVDIERYF